MKILFISSTNLGDGILTTGALDHLHKTYPNAEITVACGPLLETIFKPFPGVVRVISLKKEPYAGHWRKLMAQTFGQKWDIVADMRNSLVSRLLRAEHVGRGVVSLRARRGRLGGAVGRDESVEPRRAVTLQDVSAGRAEVLSPDPAVASGGSGA